MRERRDVRDHQAPGINQVRIRISTEGRSLAPRGPSQGGGNMRPEAPSAEGDGPQGVEGFQGVYIISVAARLLEMHPQTLRKYERLGLVSPSRTIGMLRLYSEEDIAKLRLIKHLEENLGLNLAGVEFTLSLLGHLLDMLQRLSAMKEAEQVMGVVEQEMARLFQLLNLSFHGQTSASEEGHGRAEG